MLEVVVGFQDRQGRILEQIWNSQKMFGGYHGISTEVPGSRVCVMGNSESCM